MSLEDLEKKPREGAESTATPDTINLKQSSWKEGSLVTAVEAKENFVSNFIFKFGPLGKSIFWLLVVATALVIGVGSFYLYQYFTSRDIAMSIKAPVDVLIGVPFDITINFANDSDKLLKDVKLALILPEGAAPAQSRVSDNKRFFGRDLEDLNPGASFETKIPMIIFKGAESVRRFPVTISYYLAGLGSTARLEKTGTIEVGVREPAIKLDLGAPQKVLSNEVFEIKIDYRNISDFDFSDVDIDLNLPNTFNVKEVNPTSTSASFWKIGRLAKSSGGTIRVKGSVSGAEGSFFEIKSSARNEGYLIDEKTASVNIAASPLALSARVNDQDNYIARPDENLRYVLSYKNNADIGFGDVVIKARLTGEMFDFKRLQTKGFFNSIDNTIIWNAANTPELRLVNPGAQGTVNFEIPTKQNYPIKRLSDKNFLLKLNAEISSPTVPYYVSADKTVELTSLLTKVKGQIAIIAKVFFRDTASGIENRGPLPPKVNNPTNFTIHWAIVNYSTDVSNIQVKASLLSGVHFTSKVKSNIPSLPTYNDRTGEINWAIDKIPAGKGVLGTPVEAIFQVEATPNITQVSQPMPLLSETQFTAVDDFTQNQISGSFPAITSEMISDPSFKGGQGMVVQ